MIARDGAEGRGEVKVMGEASPRDGKMEVFGDEEAEAIGGGLQAQVSGNPKPEIIAEGEAEAIGEGAEVEVLLLHS